MQRTIKAVIFDLDGIIVDTAHYHYRSWQKLFETYGFHFDVTDNEQLKGASRMNSLNIVLKLAGITKTEEEKVAMCALKNDWYLKSIEGMTTADCLPGVVELIKSVHATGMKIGLGSASRNAVMIVRQLGMAHYFDAMVDGNDVTHGKPDPEVFLKAAAQIDVPPHQCLVFEDAYKGVEAALRANMTVVGYGDAQVLGKAHLVISSFEGLDFLELVHDLNSI